MQPIKVQQGQWLGDIALGEAGSFEAVTELSYINELSITQGLENGAFLTPVEVRDQRVVNYYLRNNIIPATYDFTNDDVTGKGISYMTIDLDFVVSYLHK